MLRHCGYASFSSLIRTRRFEGEFDCVIRPRQKYTRFFRSYKALSVLSDRVVRPRILFADRAPREFPCFPNALSRKSSLLEFYAAQALLYIVIVLCWLPAVQTRHPIGLITRFDLHASHTSPSLLCFVCRALCDVVYPHARFLLRKTNILAAFRRPVGLTTSDRFFAARRARRWGLIATKISSLSRIADCATNTANGRRCAASLAMEEGSRRVSRPAKPEALFWVRNSPALPEKRSYRAPAERWTHIAWRLNDMAKGRFSSCLWRCDGHNAGAVRLP